MDPDRMNQRSFCVCFSTSKKPSYKLRTSYDGRGKNDPQRLFAFLHVGILLVGGATTLDPSLWHT